MKSNTLLRCHDCYHAHLHQVAVALCLYGAACTSSAGGGDEVPASAVDAGPIATDGAGLAPCEGVRIEDDGVLDLDINVDGVSTVTIRGAVTLDGLPLDRHLLGLGSLRFVASDVTQTETAVLLAPGAPSYRVDLTPGTYAVSYHPPEGFPCDATAPLPCLPAPISAEIDLRVDGVLDLDIPTVAIRGRVEVDRSPLVEVGVGQVSLTRNNQTGQATVSPSAQWSARLIPERYQIGWSTTGQHCNGRTTPSAPCNGDPAIIETNVQSSGAFDLQLHTVKVSGAVSVAGAPLGTLASYGGQLVFANEAGQTATVTATFNQDQYQLRLLRGTYAVRWQPAANLCDGDKRSEGPCNNVALYEGRQLDTDGTLDVDLPLVHISGRVLVAGDPVTSPSFGAISFARSKDEEPLFIPLSSAANYVATMAPGVYNIAFVGDPTHCTEDTILPCIGGASIRRSLATDGVLDLDLATVRIQGTVVFEGQPPSTFGRGAIQFGSLTGQTGLLWLPPDGNARFSATIAAGEYALSWNPSQQCAPNRPNSGPCIEGPIDEKVNLAPPGGVLDIDIPVVDLVGNLTVNGKSIPKGARGTLSFARSKGATLSVAIASQGDAEYAASLWPGRYVISWLPPAACAKDELPCKPQVLKGCSNQRIRP